MMKTARSRRKRTREPLFYVIGRPPGLLGGRSFRLPASRRSRRVSLTRGMPTARRPLLAASCTAGYDGGRQIAEGEFAVDQNPDPRLLDPQAWEDKAGEGYDNAYRRWSSMVWLAGLAVLALAGLLLLILRY